MTRQSLGTLTAIVLLAGLAVVAVGRASAVQTEARVRAEMRDSVAFVAASAFRASRDSMEVLRAATLAAERKLAKVRTDARGTLAVTGRVIDSLRSADTATTSLTVPSSSLTVAIAAYDSLAAAFRAYLAADAIVHDAADRERTGLLTTLSKADTALAAMTQARDAWKQAASCRTVFRLPCPTRTTAFVAGGIVVAAVVVGVRR